MINTFQQPTNTLYGVSCGTTGHFRYSVKGVQFLLYGTLSTDFTGFSVYIDDEFAGYVDVSNTNSFKRHVLLFTSKELIYGDHEVKVSHIQGTFELYKLAFWPEFKAQRLNITQFKRSNVNYWKAEPDGIGGVRHYSVDFDGYDSHAILDFKFTKYWLYGSKF